METRCLAGGPGFEPRLTESESLPWARGERWLGSPPLSDDHDRASLDGAKLRGREGHHSCPGRIANDETREPDALLTAIAKASGDGTNDDIWLGRIASFAEIVEREAPGERHIRLFAASRRSSSRSQENSRTFKRRRRHNPATTRKSPR
jgi:hypothetical protein